MTYTRAELEAIAATRGEKSRLVQIARDVGAKVIPDSMNNEKIIRAILEKQ